jgi:hypothetical protein
MLATIKKSKLKTGQKTNDYKESLPEEDNDAKG